MYWATFIAITSDTSARRTVTWRSRSSRNIKAFVPGSQWAWPPLCSSSGVRKGTSGSTHSLINARPGARPSTYTSCQHACAFVTRQSQAKVNTHSLVPLPGQCCRQGKPAVSCSFTHSLQGSDLSTSSPADTLAPSSLLSSAKPHW